MTYYAYAVGWALVRALPERLARRLFRIGADLAVRRDGRSVQRLATNLRRVLGPDATEAQLQATLRDAMRSYARYWLEVFRLPGMGRDRIVRGTTTTGEHHLRDAMAAGTGAICVLPHQGNWDTAGAWIVLTGVPFTTVAERLEPERLFDRFLAFRESLGMEVVPLTGGATPPMDVLADRLEHGGMLALLGDRDLTARGVPVTFFGEATRFPAGPALLALRTGAPLIPVSLWFTDDGWHIEFGEPIPAPPGDDAVGALTQAVADFFERGIRAHPADWHMLQRLWLADLDPDDPRRTAAPAAAG